MATSYDASRPVGGLTTDEARLAGQGLTFGGAAAAYERGRPTYPQEAVDWLIPTEAADVVDLGAGTGKFTRLLVDGKRTVTAVDPDAAMLDTLRAYVPGVTTLVGSAESIPLPDNSVDVVTVAQAWHWVDLDLAVAEVARVLRPGGTLALIWNVRDENEPWVAAIGEAMHRGGSQDLTERDPTVGPPFAPLERALFPWEHVVSADELRDMIASRSYTLVLPPIERERVLDEAVEIAVRENGGNDQQIAIPYITFAYKTSVAALTAL